MFFFRRTNKNARKPLAGTTGRRPAPYRPAMENLEDRCVPSAAHYSDTLQAWGTGAGTAGRNAFYYDMQGALAGNLPGSFSAHILYNGIIGHGTNPIAGGTLAIKVPGSSAAAGTLQGRLAGGSIRWNTSGRGVATTITFTITGGTGAYAHNTGVATFRGTMDRADQTLFGTLSVVLTHPASGGATPSASRSPSSGSGSTGSHSYTDTLRATGTGAGIAGGNTFYYDTRGTLAGSLPGTFSTRVYYTGILGNGTNAITGGSWSANLTGPAGTLQGRVAGGSVRWNSTGQSAAVNVSFVVTGGTGAYAGDTGTGSFQGTMDGNTEALTGTLTVAMKHT